MGGTNSTLMIDNTQLNKSITNVIVQNQNDTKQSAVTIQTIKAGNIQALSCAFSLNQDATTSLSSIQEISSETRAQIVASLMASLDQQTESTVGSKSSFGAIPANTNLYVNAKNSLTNDFETNLSTTNINKLIQSVNNTQALETSNIILDPCGFQMIPNVSPGIATALINKCDTSKPCTIDQTISAQLVAQQVTGQVMDLISNNQSVSTLVAAYKSNVQSVSSGPIEDLFSGLSNLIGAGGLAAMLPCIVSLIFCIACIILLYYISMSDAGQGAIRAGTNVAVARAGGGTGTPAFTKLSNIPNNIPK